MVTDKVLEVLDIVNCSHSFVEAIEENNVYICPAENGHYSHKRCRYFGAYNDKAVVYIADIEAVIDVHSPTEAKIRWINKPGIEKGYCEKAIIKAREVRPDPYPRRVFLLGTLHPTNFMKNSPGGMQQSKRYLDVSDLHVTGPVELAAKLNGMNWSSYVFGI